MGGGGSGEVVGGVLVMAVLVGRGGVQGLLPASGGGGLVRLVPTTVGVEFDGGGSDGSSGLTG